MEKQRKQAPEQIPRTGEKRNRGPKRKRSGGAPAAPHASRPKTASPD